MSDLLKDLSEGLQEAVDYEVGQEVKRLKTTEGGVSTMCDEWKSISKKVAMKAEKMKFFLLLQMVTTALREVPKNYAL